MTTILTFGAAVRPDGTPSTALRRRVETALAHAKGDPCVRFIPSGAVGRHGPSEASVMGTLLEQAGVAREHVILEETGLDTWSSVKAFHRILRSRTLPGPVMVATSAYHLPRCLALLCVVGIPARACRPVPGSASAVWHKRWYWRGREVLAFPYDLILAIGARLSGGV